MSNNALMLTPLAESGLSLTAHQLSTLRDKGIVTVVQLVEGLRERSKGMANLLSIHSQTLLQECEQRFPVLLDQAITFTRPFMPTLGCVLDPKDSPKLMQHRYDTKTERQVLAEHCQAFKDTLPEECLLVKGMAEVGDQLTLGSCTSFGSTAALEYVVKHLISKGFTYIATKQLDGMPDQEGSYQEYCYQSFYQIGHVLKEDYSYDQCLRGESIENYKDLAKQFRIRNYLDLLVEPEDRSLVIKAVLNGMLSDQLSARPVSISVAIHQSFVDASAYRYGLIPLPFEGDELIGGHALCIAGYTKLYDSTYFIVQNSWGTNWAADNPLGYAGYALIPEAYINSPYLVGELLTPL